MSKSSDRKGRAGNRALTEGENDFAKDALTDKIGSSLKKFYNDVLNEPVPDDFLSLLDQADKRVK